MDNNDLSKGVDTDILTHNDLDGFTGSETFYRHGLTNMIYTEGIKYLADKAKAYWLIDVIASYQYKLMKNEDTERFQLWIISVPSRSDNNQKVQYPFILPKKGHDAVISCWADSPNKPNKGWERITNHQGWKKLTNFILAQDIKYTDFPLPELSLYVCANYDRNNNLVPTLMLKSEY